MITWFAENTIVAALLAAAIALFIRLARPVPALRHALWLIVLLKLLTPPLISWPWAVAKPASTFGGITGGGLFLPMRRKG